MGGEKDNVGKTARILDIQRMSTEDGPGIRTTVFFKGCPLSCVWCHNPESISSKPQVHWIADRCIGCRTCVPICPDRALSEGETGIVIDRERCRACGQCVDACPGTALATLGQVWQLDDLVYDVLKDRTFFNTSEGGVTLSGGEPGLQSHFAAAFAEQLKFEGVHTALDTCGLIDCTSLGALLPFTDLVLFDLKIMDPDEHHRWTGRRNELILTNLSHVAEFQRSHQGKQGLWIRTPIIPGITDSMENIRGIGDWIMKNCEDRVVRWELCAFNNLCRDKYERLGKRWLFRDTQLMRESRMDALTGIARKTLSDPEKVHWSGSVRTDEDETAKGVEKV